MNQKDLKSDFNNIKDLKLDIENILIDILSKINILKQIYNSYIDKSKKNIEYLTSLDTFNFQTELLLIEHENYSSIFNIFLNRMYGEYYKLFKNMYNFIQPLLCENKIKLFIENNYIPYKDLENNIHYEFLDIENIHNDIDSMITSIQTYINNENYELDKDTIKQNQGLHINNFVMEKSYNIRIINEKIKLYLNIITNFHDFQNKFFKRLLLKLQVIYSQIISDIHLDNNSKTKIFKTSITTLFNKHNLNDPNNNFENKLKFALNNLYQKTTKSRSNNENDTTKFDTTQFDTTKFDTTEFETINNKILGSLDETISPNKNKKQNIIKIKLIKSFSQSIKSFSQSIKSKKNPILLYGLIISIISSLVFILN